MDKITVPKIISMKDDTRIVMVTAYDAPTAAIVDEAGVDIVLVGDSLGNVVQGHLNTLPVTLEESVYHTKIVSRALRNAHLCSDMPFLSFQISREEALRNAGRLVKEANAESVKIEISEDLLDTLYAIQRVGIPVMGHIGLTPQSVHKMGGYKMQGREKNESQRLIKLARQVEEAGAYSLVLEGIPASLAKAINIPTIGIGAGPSCDGQVLLIHVLLGISEEPLPKFVKKYASLRQIMTEATSNYADEDRKEIFPSDEHSSE